MSVSTALAKTNEWHETRRQTLGGSDANILMNGEPEAIIALWQEKRGEREPEDLSGVLPVQMGVWTEPLNRHWFELTMERSVVDEGETRTCAAYDFMACTLDGLTTTQSGDSAVFEAKHVNAFAKIDEVAQKYMPQLHHNMFVCGVTHSILSVFIGTLKHEVIEVECDDWYLAQLIDRERAFWNCVQAGEPPAEMKPVEPPTAPEDSRTVDMEGNNEWASAAVDWLDNKDASKAFDKATKAIKKMMEDDVGHAFGHGVQIKRAKNGSLRITEMKNA